VGAELGNVFFVSRVMNYCFL